MNGMFHQMHCLWAFNEAFMDKMKKLQSGGEHGHGHGHGSGTSHARTEKRDDHSNGAGHAHLSHCLSYLRQTLLCKASPSLEKGDFFTRNYASSPLSPGSPPLHDGSMVCEDWTKVFEWAEDNFDVFLETASKNETYLKIFTTGKEHVTH